MTVALSALSAAQSMPNGSRGQWKALDGINYHGFPVYVNQMDGTMVYEADFERLVSLPEEDEDRIVDILMMDFSLKDAGVECREAICGRAN